VRIRWIDWLKKQDQQKKDFSVLAVTFFDKRILHEIGPSLGDARIRFGSLMSSLPMERLSTLRFSSLHVYFSLNFHTSLKHCLCSGRRMFIPKLDSEKSLWKATWGYKLKGCKTCVQKHAAWIKGNGWLLVKFLLARGESLTFTLSLGWSPVNIAINDISLKATFFGLHFCRRKYLCRPNHFYVIRPESYRIRWNYAAARAITPFKVIQGHRV